jgi:hypothetical protein
MIGKCPKCGSTLRRVSIRHNTGGDEVKDFNIGTLVNDAIAKREATRDKELAKISERVKKLAADAAQVATDLACFNTLDEDFREVGKSVPKAKRTPTTVPSPTVDAVLKSLLPYTDVAQTIAEIKADLVAPFDSLSSKTVGAALRQLVTEGKAIESPRGRWKNVMASATGTGEPE